MKAWVELYQAHREGRASSHNDWGTALRKRLIKLADEGHCDRTIQARFTYSIVQPRLCNWTISNGPLALLGVPALPSAMLTLEALTDKRSGHLHMFTAMIEGEREDSSKWTLAVHLPDDRESGTVGGDRQGLGAAGHAAFHCHIGPDMDTEPKVRAPLPAIEATDALDWVLSQILPKAEFEPAPWPNVQSVLKKQ